MIALAIIGLALALAYGAALFLTWIITAQAEREDI